MSSALRIVHVDLTARLRREVYIMSGSYPSDRRRLATTTRAVVVFVVVVVVVVALFCVRFHRHISPC
jgi:hypothetical protein